MRSCRRILSLHLVRHVGLVNVTNRHRALSADAVEAA